MKDKSLELFQDNLSSMSSVRSETKSGKVIGISFP